MCVDQKKFFSTKKISQILGVSESSIKRWIDQNKIKGIKTKGGHRRVFSDDLYHFLKNSSLAVNKKALCGGDFFSKLETNEDKILMFLNFLEQGDFLSLSLYLEYEILSGKNKTIFLQEIVYPAFLKLRSKCIHPSQECATLHKSIHMIINAMQRFYLPASKPKKGPTILFADIGYAVDALYCYLGEMAVYDVCSTIQLGTDIDPAVIKGAISRIQPDILWLSGQDPQNKMPHLKGRFKKLYSDLDLEKTKIVTPSVSGFKVKKSYDLCIPDFLTFRKFVKNFKYKNAS